jgi:hypothetical protein
MFVEGCGHTMNESKYELFCIINSFPLKLISRLERHKLAFIEDIIMYYRHERFKSYVN